MCVHMVSAHLYIYILCVYLVIVHFVASFSEMSRLALTVVFYVVVCV